MTVVDILMSDETRKRLGDAGIREVSRNLYALDCQLCGEPLGRPAPALTVTDFGATAQAWLHHDTCQPPTWDSQGHTARRLTDPAYLTYHVQQVQVGLPLFPGTAPMTPLVVLNPSMEGVALARDGEVWRVGTVARFRRRGLCACNRRTPIAPVVLASAYRPPAVHSARQRLIVELVGGQWWWEMTILPPLAACMQELGLILVVTTSIDPLSINMDTYTAGDVVRLLDSGECAVGWMPLSEYRPGTHRP